MTQHDDQQLVDYLFDELSEEEAPAFERLLEDDPELSEEVSSLGETLDVMRELEAEDPPEWLSAKVMAEARQVAEAAQDEGLWGRLRKLMWGPAGGLVGAGAVAVALAAVVTPQMLAEQAPRSADQVAFELGRREFEPTLEPKTAQTRAAAPSKTPSPAQTEAPKDRLEASEAKEGLGAVASAVREDASAEKAAKPKPRSSARRARAQAPARRPAPPAATLGDAKGGKADARGVFDFESKPVERPAATPPAPRPEPAAPTGGPAVDDFAAASAPAEEKKRAKAKKKAEAVDPDRLARDLLAAARGEIARGDVAAARRVLTRAAQRLSAYPQRGHVFVARAQLELREGDLDAAERYARAALGTQGFDDKASARDVLRRVQRQREVRSAPSRAGEAH